MAATTITATQVVPVSFTAVDRKGNPAALDGVPEWATDNSDVLLITPSADGRTCDVAAVGPMGAGKVQVTVDGDLGAGMTPLIGVIDVTVTAGGATVIQLVPGTPVEQP